MKNFIGFFVAIAVGALALFGYGYYRAEAENNPATSVAHTDNTIHPEAATSDKVAQAVVEKEVLDNEAVNPEPMSEAAPSETAEKPAEKPVAPAEKTPEAKPAPQAKTKPASQSAADNFDKKMREYGLVDIRTLDKNILVDLKYSTTDNFVGKDMYGSLERAYLERKFAEKVLKAQQILRKRYPNYTLLIYDAARPISVQRTMKKIVAGTEFDCFVASGKTGGRHNYGVAVDLTIADKSGKPLDMGTGFDSFDKASSVKGTPDTSDPSTRTIAVYRAFVRKLQADGLISKQAADNRILLLEVMLEAGLYPYRNEWWHFELINSMSSIRETYRLLDF